MFTNSYLNLNQRNFKQNSLFQNALFYFSKDIGINCGIYLSEYEVSTDESYMPFEDIEFNRGVMVNGQPLQAVISRSKP